MITKKDILDNVLRAIRRESSAKDRLQADAILQKHVLQVSEQHSFHKLRQVIELDLSGAGELPLQGVWLPSNLAGIDMVRDVGQRDYSGDCYIRRDESHLDPDETVNRYFSYVPDVQPAFEGDDVIVNQGADFFESATLHTAVGDGLDVEGEWVRFGGVYGFYQITGVAGSQYQIEPTYQGESVSQVAFEVRPRGTQKLACVKPNGDQVQTGTVRVHYWTFHPPLHRDTDIMLFPHAGLIESLVTRDAINIIARRQLSSDKYIRDIDEGWRTTRRLNPAFPRQTGPRGKANRPFEMNRSPFKRRD